MLSADCRVCELINLAQLPFVFGYPKLRFSALQESFRLIFIEFNAIPNIPEDAEASVIKAENTLQMGIVEFRAIR